MADSKRSRQYKVIGTIKSIKGRCSEGHKVGETFELNHLRNVHVCGNLFRSVYPNLWMLQTGGNPWDDEEKLEKGLLMRCPDIENEVTIELKRINA